MLLLWLSFPFVTITSKCLLSKRCFCCCYHPTTATTESVTTTGADFRHPITAATLQLLSVGLLLNGLVRIITILYLYMYTTKTACTEQEHEVSDERVALLSHHNHPAENSDTNAANANAANANAADNSTTNATTTNTNTKHVQPHFKDCLAVGFAFGAKYATAHYALQYTPTAAIYELFHCWNIVFVALWANAVLGERLKSWGEKLACLGIIAGSFALIYSSSSSHSDSSSSSSSGKAITTTSNVGKDEHDDNTQMTDTADLSLDLLSLLLNLLNGFLAGGVVVLLRLTMLRSSSCSSSRQVTTATTNNNDNDDGNASQPSSSEHTATTNNLSSIADSNTNSNGIQALRATQVTAYKMLIGGLVLIPFCLAVDGGFTTILSMTRQQLKWLLLSSITILIYHINLTWLCWRIRATTVGMLEAFRPVPAFLILSFLQPQQQKEQSIAWFWFGAITILVSTIIFECSKRNH